MNQIDMCSSTLKALETSEMVAIDGGWTDPYNTIHNNYPVAAAIADFAEGVAEGFKAGVESWGKFFM